MLCSGLPSTNTIFHSLHPSVVVERRQRRRRQRSNKKGHSLATKKVVVAGLHCRIPLTFLRTSHVYTCVSWQPQDVTSCNIGPGTNRTSSRRCSSGAREKTSQKQACCCSCMFSPFKVSSWFRVRGRLFGEHLLYGTLRVPRTPGDEPAPGASGQCWKPKSDIYDHREPVSQIEGSFVVRSSSLWMMEYSRHCICTSKGLGGSVTRPEEPLLSGRLDEFVVLITWMTLPKSARGFVYSFSSPRRRGSNRP